MQLTAMILIVGLHSSRLKSNPFSCSCVLDKRVRYVTIRILLKSTAVHTSDLSLTPPLSKLSLPVAEI